MSIAVSEIPVLNAASGNNVVPIQNAAVKSMQQQNPDSDSEEEEESQQQSHNNGLAISNMPVNYHAEHLLKQHQQMLMMSAMPNMALQPVPVPEIPGRGRSKEEDHCIILSRNSSSTSKSSNTKYRCKYCSFEFVGGPQKIRVHLTGKRENGTRLSKCEKAPEEVRLDMEKRMRTPKESHDVVTLMDDPADVPQKNIAPRSQEENHVIIMSRSDTAACKSSNSRYKCLYCRFKFVGGPQKIRVHLTGLVEGGTRVAKCPRAPPDVVAAMESRRKASKMLEGGTMGLHPGMVQSAQMQVSGEPLSVQESQQIPLQMAPLHLQQHPQLQPHQLHHIMSQQHHIPHHEAAVAVHKMDQQQQAHQYHLLQQQQLHQQQQAHLMATNPEAYKQQQQQIQQMQLQQQLQIQQAQQQHLAQQQHMHHQQQMAAVVAAQHAAAAAAAQQQQQQAQAAQQQAHAAQQAAANANNAVNGGASHVVREV